ncbi:Drf-GBD domain-containing protein [Mycena venus]|uniref:Drf-GBD domain-containing protein n=1 Tax=Mycena venus TaxID=2733690 RepID=A0A8H7CI61_9AGAR|nr:Drf-GBD domain-containing protein [Mycena venus]
MFKGILPKRIASSDFTMVTTLVEPPATAPNKENQPGASKPPRAPMGKGNVQSRKRADTKTKDRPPMVSEQASATAESMEVAFDKLLEDLQIPSTLRPRLVGMESTVKAAMLKSSQTMALAPLPLPLPATQNTPPLTPRSVALRRTRSTESLDSPRRSKASLEYEPPRAPALFGESALASSVGPAASPSRKTSGHARGTSFDTSRLLSKSQVHLPVSASVVDLTGKASKERGAAGKEKVAKDISPTRFFSILSGTSSTQLDIENVKKLRLLLRNESASWSEEFLKLGGYAALLTRLNEILEVEWREEQHDDQILHELLRCFKALSTSSIGCFALRSSCPTPFVQLVALLYSDKKPGDVATRQLIVDLLLILFELYPSSLGDRLHRSNLEQPHHPTCSAQELLLADPRAATNPPRPRPLSPLRHRSPPHAFIESLHKPRIYKTYLQELSDVCRDYFWVFCHPNNTIWILSETDEGRVEKPRAPGGMTGGVEFEAMGYFTTHLKLVNSIAKAVADLNLPKDNDHSAYRFHADLFLSGFERIILISRKASTTYYPTLHLELARYVAHCGRAGYELPWTVSRLVGVPPPALAKIRQRQVQSTVDEARQRNVGGAGVSGAPALPSPRKIEPMNIN